MEDLFIMDRRNMNLIERLIVEVKTRPLLWDRYANDYNNRAAMDKEWEQIAVLLQREKDFIKLKWRNLRDQFQRECKKVKIPFDNPTKPYFQYYRGKWIYFKDMLFLKDHQSKRICFPPQEIQIHESDIKEELIVFEEDVFMDQVHQYNNDSDNYENEPSITSHSEETEGLIQPKIEVIEDSEEDQSDIGRKRKASESISEPVSSVKVKKPLVVENSTNTEDLSEIDDDLHFVKSLVPYLRKLSPIRKLFVRNEIQSLLIKESLCEKCKHGESSSNNTCR